MQAVEGGARAIAVDAQGSILAHGTLVPLSGLNPVLAAAALWQVAAMATAQHYLVAMQQQLARIEAAINELRDWLEDREVAGLVTSARYLQDALAAHASAQPPALSDRVANQGLNGSGRRNIPLSEEGLQVCQCVCVERAAPHRASRLHFASNVNHASGRCLARPCSTLGER
jgi:hypothetical protein